MVFTAHRDPDPAHLLILALDSVLSWLQALTDSSFLLEYPSLLPCLQVLEQCGIYNPLLYFTGNFYSWFWLTLKLPFSGKLSWTTSYPGLGWAISRCYHRLYFLKDSPSVNGSLSF
jgi:hypothetical protein